MSVHDTEVVTDEHGVEHRLVTFGCDGPGCERSTLFDSRLPIGDLQALYEWATVLGFDDDNAVLCSMRCLKGWAAAL